MPIFFQSVIVFSGKGLRKFFKQCFFENIISQVEALPAKQTVSQVSAVADAPSFGRTQRHNARRVPTALFVGPARLQAVDVST